MFYWLFLGEVSHTKFPVKSADFSKNLPLKILRNLTFSANIPRNRLVFLRTLTFLPRKFCKIGRFFCEYWLFSAKIPRNWPIFPRICPWKSREILLFFPRNIRSPVHSINHHPADKVQGNQLQHAKKVVSDGQGLMDFAIRLVNSVLDLPDGRVMFFEEFK